MAEQIIAPCGSAEVKERERVRYFPKQLVTADDMLQEQRYWREKLRRHNRFMHGWGVVCGLDVNPKSEMHNTIPWTITISEGYALSPSGDEIQIEAPLTVDVRKIWSAPESIIDICAETTNTCDEAMSPLPQETYFLAVKYCERLASPIQVSTSSCGSGQRRCEYSRILDACQIALLSKLPECHDGVIKDKTQSCVRECPMCQDDDWVVLANVVADEHGNLAIKYKNRLITEMNRPTHCFDNITGLVIKPDDSIFEVNVSPTEEPMGYIEVKDPSGSIFNLPVNFSINPDGEVDGETLTELMNREKNRQFFDPKTGKLTYLPDILTRAGVDMQTKVASIADINALLR